MKKLSPISFFKFLKTYIREVQAYTFYVKKINSLIESKEFEKRGLRTDSLKRIFFVKNLEPEILIYGDAQEGGRERFEKTFVAEELKNYNDLFITSQLIDIVKTSLKRIQDKDYYAYLVMISFRFTEFTFLKSLYIILYLSGLTYLIHKLIGWFEPIKTFIQSYI